MLHYCKMILGIMSIDTQLFVKELNKAYCRLSPNQAHELYEWSKKTYPHMPINQPGKMIRA